MFSPPTASQTHTKKTKLTQEELEKEKELEELLLGKGELSSVASTYLQKKWELPSAVYVITSKDIHETGTRRLTDLFRLAPGVAVSNLDRTFSSVSIRGLKNPVNTGANTQLLALQDGRNLFWPTFGTTLWEQIPLLLGEIDRIEIMRGPGSALYGASALSGVINIITKDPEKTHGVSVWSGGGSQETAFTDVMFGHGIGNFDFRLGTGYERDAGFGDHNGMGIPDTIRYSKTTFRGKYRFTPELSAELLAGVTYGTAQPSFHINLFRSRLMEHQWPYIHTRVKWDISDTQELLLQHNWQIHSWQEREETTPFLDTKETLQEWELRHSILFGERNRIVWGANLRDVRIKSPWMGGATVVEPDRWRVSDVIDHDTVTGAYIQDELKILENLRATLGIKFENNTFTGGDYAPRASLVYAPWKEHAFRASAARAFRPPTFIEDAFKMSFPSELAGLFPFRAVGNKGLDNETLRSFELGYTGRFLGKLDVNIETFNYDYDDLIVFTLVETPDPRLTFENLDSATSRGIEVDLKYPVTKWWEVGTNYSFVHFDDTRNVLQRLYPAHIANVRTLFRLPEDFTAHLWVNFFGDIDATTPGAIRVGHVGDYARFDMRIAKGFAKGRGEVSFTGQNLFGDHAEGGIHRQPGNGFDLVEIDRKVLFALDLHF